jgi:catalase
MPQPPISPPPLAKTLTEQKSDFTAEGSPPPGKVSTSVPVTAPEPGKKAPPPAKQGRATRALPDLPNEVQP